MTKATRDLAETLNESLRLRDTASVKTLEYGKIVKYKDDKICLVKADHILGAAQVLVEEAGGIRIVWTGDFRLDGTPVVDCDVLVVEATYGSPACRRNFDVDIRELLVSMIEKRLRGGTVYVFGYHGKLKLCKSWEADVEVPFVMPERVYEVTKVCEKHGMRLRSLSLSTEKKGEKN
jgi:putative mRNA 3-end processing factor